MPTGQRAIRTFKGSNFGEFFGGQSVSQLRGLEDTFSGISNRFASNVESTGGERNALRSGVSSAVAQNFKNVAGGPRGFANQLTQTERKAKARAQITNRGESAIRNQQLRDRMTIAKQKLGRVGQINRATSQAANLRTSIDFAEEDAADARAQGIAGAVGGIAGGVSGLLSNRQPGAFDFSLPGDSTVEGLSRGTAGADLFGEAPSPLSFAEQFPQPGRA